MTSPDGLHVVQVMQQDYRLGRQCVHDPRSRQFEFPRQVELPTKSFRHRVYDPSPTPNQEIGCCTGVDQCVKADTAGNRVRGVVLGMADAVKIYSRATQIDPWPGEYPPTDSGSSALAACKAAQEAGIIETYQWIFGGVDQILAALVHKPVGVGTWWYGGMMNPDPRTLLIEPTGERVGGHQYSVVGWNKPLDAFDLHLWWDGWGANGLARIRRRHLAELLADDGDSHVAYRSGVNG